MTERAPLPISHNPSSILLTPSLSISLPLLHKNSATVMFPLHNLPYSFTSLDFYPKKAKFLISLRIPICGGMMNIYFYVKYVHMLIWPLHPFPTPNKAKIQAREIILCENSSSIPTPEVPAATTVPQRGSAIVIREERSE